MMHDKSVYGLVVIGGGICGLYQATKFLRKNPNGHVCVVEKEPYFGGRALQTEFCGVLVPTGAGIGRYNKDKKLLKLLNSFDINPITFEPKVQHDSITNIVNLEQTLNQLKQHFSQKPQQVDFRTFATHHLGPDMYEAFVDTAGYSDFEKLDVYDALFNYGFDDLYTTSMKFYVPWNQLIDKMIAFIKKHKSSNLITSNAVVNLNTKDKIVTLQSGQQIKFIDYVITASPYQLSSSILRQLPYNIDSVHTQPFAYLYAQLSKSSSINFACRFDKMTIVPRPLQKIIPMDLSKNVWMIAYCDNDSGIYMRDNVKTRRDLENVVYKTLRIKINVLHFKIFFREIGTHYRTRHEAYINSKHLKGEAYALNQGWTNGGL